MLPLLLIYKNKFHHEKANNYMRVAGKVIKELSKHLQKLFEKDLNNNKFHSRIVMQYTYVTETLMNEKCMLRIFKVFCIIREKKRKRGKWLSKILLTFAESFIWEPQKCFHTHVRIVINDCGTHSVYCARGNRISIEIYVSYGKNLSFSCSRVDFMYLKFFSIYSIAACVTRAVLKYFFKLIYHSCAQLMGFANSI